jgi:glycerol kinase
VRSRNRLLTTIAYRLNGEVDFALEGSVFISGAAVQWLRDGLGLVARAGDSEAIARSIEGTGGVYLVPAFTGLGAPWWDPEARGAILGLTRDSSRAAIVRAALEASVYQTRDLLNAMRDDGAARPTALKADGGMAANDWVMQFLADQLAIPVERPKVTETTALGAAFLAALGVGVFGTLGDVAKTWRSDKRFAPGSDRKKRDKLYAGWRDAVLRVRTA